MILVSRVLRLTIGFLVLLNVLVVAFVAAVLLFGLPAAPGSQPVDAARPTPRPTPLLMLMGAAHIPTTNACVLCHGAGGDVKTVPGILHPIEGWRRCIQCHTDTKLGRAAPGHEGIAEEECLNCHRTAQTGPAITQPHARLHDQQCLDCHGGVAHLPSTMAGSSATGCVLCHKPAVLPPPQYPHAPDARLSCRSCHRSAEAGALPIDHALRADDTCLLCHDIHVAAVGLPSGGQTHKPDASPAPAPTDVPTPRGVATPERATPPPSAAAPAVTGGLARTAAPSAAPPPTPRPLPTPFRTIVMTAPEPSPPPAS
jgi:hypothetical protein